MSNKTRPLIVWALFTASLVAIFTSFIAIILAYVWRKSDPGYKVVYDKKFRRFWTAGLGWALGLSLFSITAFTDTRPAGSSVPLLNNIGLVVIVVTQLWFALSAFISMFNIPAPTEIGVSLRRFA